MRYAILLTCLPGLALAEDVRLVAPPAEAVIYASGATITRRGSVDLPAGSHRVLVPVLPGADGPPRIEVAGAALGAQETLVGGLIDGRDLFTPAQQTAYDAWQAAREAEARAEDARLAAAAAHEAAGARLAFLRSISGQELAGFDAAAIAATATALGDGVRRAQQDLSEARAALRAAEREAEDAAQDRAQAKRDFDATGADLGPVTLLAVAVRLDAPGSVDLTLQDFSPQAGWTPLYDARLSEESGQVTLDRKVQLFQSTGLPLQDVVLRLSTADPFAQVAPRPVAPDLVTTRPDAPIATREMAAADIVEMRMAPAAAEPIRGQVDADGPVVTYDFPVPVDIPMDGGRVTLALDTLTFEARVFNRAAPRTDRTAFLMAELTNDTAEPMLAGPMALFRDDAKIGEGFLPPLPAGDEVEIAFGPQEHLQLEFRLLDNETGDRGLIFTSGTRAQDMVLRVRNLSSEVETVETRFALPYSEEEDLDVTIAADPAPDLRDVEERRGVAQWNLNVPARDEAEIRLGVRIEWPEGETLNWQP
ncbi:DUF4139 domain-containing protein [Jannaschia sp. S6380]|uniref:mucoidy inhibitor MuiA family protein n=1 Tax=Jannaschia sp. S6380 TaxID=2926408 RepID=UPI001FF645B4|nr:mucoidy inhibitor MuiA family protein [Jannaschia sp. S6380]MCK0168789.1 DUF4139 domain-containing protein [Jannaschia sp. S6380]